MDLTPFTDALTDVTAAVGTVGAGLVAVVVATLGFSFVAAWIRKITRAGSRG